MDSRASKKVVRFEDLDVWQKARKLTQLVYRLTAGRKFCGDYGLSDQMRRAAVSIMANIAEGFGRKSDKEFSQFLFIAKSSAAELQSHAYVSMDQAYLDKAEFESLYAEADGTSRMLSNLIKYLSGVPSNRRPAPTRPTHPHQLTQ